MSIKQKNHTTTNIGAYELKVLNKLAIMHKTTNISILNAAVIYLYKTGIDPNQPELSPKDEIAKLEKRVIEVLRFFRTFEQDKLLPILERLIILDKKIEASMGNLPQKSELISEFSQIRDLLRSNTENLKRFTNQKY